MRESKAESIIWAVLVLALTIVAVAMYFANKGTTTTGTDEMATNAPFRDGIYLGTLDAKNGKMPHIAVGRWSSDSDRKFFIRGYQAAYGQTVSLLNQKSGVNLNTLAAYRDGLYLGKLDAEQGRNEHAGVGRWARLQDKELFAFGYHEAYLNEIAQLHVAGQTSRFARTLTRTETTADIRHSTSEISDRREWRA